jgi:hypothetical protein
MASYISNPLTNFLELFTSHTHKPVVLTGDVDITQMAEHVVDVVDPRIRVIGRYARKLSQPLSHTWDYLTEMANLIPGGVTIDRENFSNNPHMKLLFESQSGLQQLLDTIDTLLPHHIHDATYNDRPDSQLYMLLCMEKRERNFLGTELAGDIIKRDVMQTSVTFSNRKFLSAGYNEEDAKLGFKRCALEGLLHKTHGLIMQSRNEEKQLIARKKQLRQQLHTVHDSKYKQDNSLFSHKDHLTDTHPELVDIERQLTEIRLKSESPSHHLSQVIETLMHPEHHLKMEKQSLTLSNLGIKLQDNTGEKGIKIEYADVEIEQSLKRTAMILSSSTKDLFPHKIH